MLACMIDFQPAYLKGREWGAPMNGENQLLVTNALIEFEK
jgi:hypothetical protein